MRELKVTQHSLNLQTGEQTEKALVGEELDEWIESNIRNEQPDPENGEDSNGGTT